MSRCIYCLKETIPREEAESPLNPSMEHIIPYSLGGSDGFATRDAHVKCNSSLGDTTDAACINQPYVVILRQHHGIRGRKGNVPDLVLPAISSTGNKPAKMTIPHGKKAVFKHEPTVLRQPENFGEQILVVGDDADVTKIVSGIAAKAQKRGNRAVDPATGADLDVRALIDASPREFHKKYHLDFVIDFGSLHREIVKIAYGFGHLIFGWRWTMTKEARRLRVIAKGAGDREDVAKLITPFNPEMREILPMGDAGPDDHFVVLMDLGDEVHIAVSLFSHAPLSAGVRLDVDRQILNAGIAEHNLAMAVINHQSRKTAWTTHADLAAHLRHALNSRPFR